MNEWELVYRAHGAAQLKPDKFVVDNIPFLKRKGIRSIYDYGAGTGRNALLLAKAGFSVKAYDPSPESRKLLRAKIAECFVGRVTVLRKPLKKAESVGCVIAIRSIHHAKSERIGTEIKSLMGLLKPGGLLLLKVLSEDDPASELGQWVEERTRKGIPNWIDGSIPHHFFSESELRSLFQGNMIISLKKREEHVEFFADSRHHYFELVTQKN